MPDHPLALGKTSGVERGPWHYGADYVTVYFKGEPARLRSLVPRPFEVGDGRCMAYVCEIVSVSDSGAAMVASEPDRTVYQEAAVGVGCSYKGKTGIFYPAMWVTTEWSLLRGLVNGYQKRLADKVALTKTHPLNPGLKPTAPGAKFSGFCIKGANRTLSVNMTVRRPGSPSDLPRFGATYGMRHYPKTDRTQSTVSEAVEITKSNSVVSDVWLGDGSLETTLDVGRPAEMTGAVYRSGFTISGSKVLNS